MDLITSLTSQVMNKALDGLSMRHKAIASNLANVDTPGYRRKDVSFEDTLKQALEENRHRGHQQANQPASNDTELEMRGTRPEHFGPPSLSSISDLQPQMTETEGVESRNDGNAVDVETEMVQLAKNTEKYMALSNLQSRSLRSLKSVITNGG